MALDIHKLMQGLASQRPLFHSEADFQHALAWHIREAHSESAPRLEYPVPPETTADDGRNKSPIYLDIWLPGYQTAIELKYRTRKPDPNQDSLDYQGEIFRLKSQGAQDIARYDFLRDIHRLERIARHQNTPAKVGYAVFLTNEKLYWEPPGNVGTIDADLRIHQSQKLKGTVAWAEGASDGTKKGREKPIPLKGPYQLDWRHYSDVEGTYGKFWYLAVEIRPT